MELVKQKTIYIFILLIFSFNFGSCRSSSNNGELEAGNCGVIIRPDPKPFEQNVLESGDWPWLVSIYTVIYWGLQHSCSGTLINVRAVLTTAQCVNQYADSENFDELVVRLGQTNLSDWTAVSPPIKRVIIHPKYQDSREWNMAIIELKENVEVTDFIKPACFWTSDNAINEGDFGYEARWTLETVNITSIQIVSKETCSLSDYCQDINLETTICANQTSIFRNPANFGSGLLLKQNGRWRLWGIYTHECSSGYKTYLDITKVFDWLESNLPEPDATPGILESASEFCGKSDLVDQEVLEPSFYTELKSGDWPWMAGIYGIVEASLRLKCLGTLITSRTILTAAKCANNTQMSVSGDLVRLGQINAAAANQATLITSTIKYYVPYPEQNVDLAIGVFQKKIRFTNLVRPACLWFDNIESNPILNCSNIGDVNNNEYGFTVRWDSSVAGTLISGKILNEKTCLQNSDEYRKNHNSARFCAGNRTDLAPPHREHRSGGAGLLVKRNDRWMIRGVAIFETFYLERPYVIYTDVKKTIDWIKSAHSEIKEKDTATLLSVADVGERCGQIYPDIKFLRLAYGGFEIQRGSWPWLVGIFRKRYNFSSFICGGTLISTKFILSAAHCFFNTYRELTKNEVKVYLGLHEINNTDAQGVISPAIEKISIHKDYSGRRKESDADIAIIKLKEPISFSKYIQPACVWADPDASYDQIGSVVGWGRNENGTVARKPRQVYARIVDGEECLRSNDAFQYVASRRNFCAGNRDKSGPCQGDSGSGLLVDKNGRLYLRGIVSVSLSNPALGCDLSEFVVYSDVSKYIDWIRNITGY